MARMANQGLLVRTALRRTSAAMATGTSAAQTLASRLAEPLARRVMQVQPDLLVLLGLPVRYIGVGEQDADLQPFDAREFIEALFSEER